MNYSLISKAVAVTFTSFPLIVAAQQPTFDVNQLMHEAKNTCIVRFDDSVDKFDVEGRVRGMLVAANAKAKHVYKNTIKGVALKMPCHQAQNAFGNEPDIMSFEQDSLVFALAPPPGKGKNKDEEPTDPPTTSNQQVPWGIDRVGGAGNSNGLTAWVIDTGVDLDNPDLNVVTGLGFTAFSSGIDNSFDDYHGHGTHVAGTIAAIDNDIGVVGVAAGADVVPIKVLNSSGSGTTSGVIAGVEHVQANAESVGACANMSLGGGYSQSLNDAVIALASSGVMVALAAGNERQNANNVSPASANGENIWTISAIDHRDAFARFSNYGSSVDFAAPGVDVVSLRAGGGLVEASGTSMAAPHACGVLLRTNGQPNSDGKAKRDPDGNADSIISVY